MTGKRLKAQLFVHLVYQYIRSQMIQYYKSISTLIKTYVNIPYFLLMKVQRTFNTPSTTLLYTKIIKKHLKK